MRTERVDYRRIRILLKSGKSCNWVSKRFNLPRSVIYRIRDGHNVEELVRGKKSREYLPEKEGFCTHCKHREIADGNRFLCEFCFKNARNGEIYPEECRVVL